MKHKKKIKTKLKNIIYNIINMVKEEKLYPVPQPVNTNELLKGKVALITGGSGGIGQAIANAFIKSGCKVIIAGTNEEKLKKCISKSDDNMKYIVLNILDVKGLSTKVKQAAELFAENKIDILVNAAGVVTSNTFLDITEEEYDSILDVNTKGTYFISQVISKHMIKNKVKGHILNITSASALRPAQTPYQISKWAVRGFTIGLAEALLPYGIIVNAIAPGPVATTMLGKKEGDSISMPKQPSRRYAMPSEIASQAVFMVSDMGNLIVGETVYMTGGSGILDLKY